MPPELLNKTVAPVIYEQTQNLLRLWSEKTRLARGRPFQADDDVIRNLVDVILSVTYGMGAGVINGQLSLLAQTSSIRLPDCLDAPPSFPEVREPRIYTAIRTLVNSIQIGMSSPFPKYHMLLALYLSPSLVLTRYYTKWVTVKVLQKSWSKFSQDPESPAHSAADLLVRREIRMASKEVREARYNTQAIRDELFGFYLAGHETTSTTLCWAFKHATAHQDAQRKLRQALHSTHTRAYQEGRLPTPDEIVHADCPYLDAFIEENHRLGLAIPSVIRRATKDCVVLGHNIPKGTESSCS
ncbi:Cytochrome P450 [Moelleriella libera RCEF 2490]|uniref:Cytochrome P450 n=1 Tax=Moelleriella libera RCEF 2490 TaxID=1081109 RepID=A0A167VHZ1_9HYPO|nr:Cytochrome P450 [Moelleriella libera RCEF 2490]